MMRMSKIGLVIIFCVISFGSLSQRDEFTSDQFLGCWVDSREETESKAPMSFFRPCDFKEFPASRFRFEMRLFDDGACHWKFLDPGDKHGFKLGSWRFNPFDNEIQILDETGNQVHLFKVQSVGQYQITFDLK